MSIRYYSMPRLTPTIEFSLDGNVVSAIGQDPGYIYDHWDQKYHNEDEARYNYERFNKLLRRAKNGVKEVVRHVDDKLECVLIIQKFLELGIHDTARWYYWAKEEQNKGGE